MSVADFAASTGALQNRIMITSNTIWRVPVGVKQIRVSACAAGGDGEKAENGEEALPGKAGQFILYKIFDVDQRQAIPITVGSGNTIIGNLQTLIAASIEMSYETDILGIKLGIAGGDGTNGVAHDNDSYYEYSYGKGGKGGYGGAFGIGGVGAGGSGMGTNNSDRRACGGAAGGENVLAPIESSVDFTRGKNGTESVEAAICAETFGDGKKFNTSSDIPADVKVGAAAGDAIGFGAGGGAGGRQGYRKDGETIVYYDRGGAPGKGAPGMVYIEW